VNILRESHNFTMWANLAHGLLMVVRAAMSWIDRYWSKFLTDIPAVLILALGMYLLRLSANLEQSCPEASGRSVARHNS
jgi:hypothetical protein